MQKTGKDLIKELLKPLTYADGTPIPDEAFENDLPVCKACKEAGRLCAHPHD